MTSIQMTSSTDMVKYTSPVPKRYQCPFCDVYILANVEDQIAACERYMGKHLAHDHEWEVYDYFSNRKNTNYVSRYLKQLKVIR